MNKFINFKFTKSVQALTLALLITPFFFSCKENDKPEEPAKSSAKEMTNVKVNVAAPVGQLSTQQTGNEFVFMYPLLADENLLKTANVTFVLPAGAEASPESGEEVDLSAPAGVEFTVTAEDGTTVKYTVKMSKETSSETRITKFSIYIGGEDVDGVISDENSTVSFNIPQELWEELDGIVPEVTLSLGATANPATTAPQDFREEVTYEVTAHDGTTKRTWTVTCTEIIPEDGGFTNAERGETKTFIELGYPGKYHDSGVPGIQYGDLNLYHAYCGDYIVLVSRAYCTNADADLAAEHGVKVVNKTTLNAADIELNLGSIDPANLSMVTSDYKGRCVAAVSVSGSTEFFYWTTPTDAPVSVGSIALNLIYGLVPAHNFQVAGDITGDAWITALAPLSVDGDHYRIQVTDGQLASTHSMIKTGYASNDCSLFQMISPFDDSDSPNYVVGDTEGEKNPADAGQWANATVKAYINNFAGGTLSTMPAHWNGEGTFAGWPGWNGTGNALIREGARRPVVSALPINDKTYVAVTSGSLWWHGAGVFTSDLQTLAHENLGIVAGEFTVNWGFGSWIDWYADDDLQEAYLAIWLGRYGLYTFKMTW